MSGVGGVVFAEDLSVTPQSATYATNDVAGNVEYVFKGSLPSISFDDVTLTLNSIIV